MGRLVEAHDVRLSELEGEGGEKARQAREQRQELQVCLVSDVLSRVEHLSTPAAPMIILDIL